MRLVPVFVLLACAWGVTPDVFHHYKYHASDSGDHEGFWHLSDRSVTAASFGVAWSAALADSSNPGQAKGCEDMISLFWIQRPHWFIPTRGEVMQLRECLDFAASQGPVTDPVVLSVVADLHSVAYSPLTDLFLRRPVTALDEIVDLETKRAGWPLFQAFIANSPVIRSLLEDVTADGESALLELNAADTIMATQLLGSVHVGSVESSNLVHSGDFVDSVYAAAAMRSVGAATLPLWRALALSVADFDSDELHFESRKPDVVTNAAAVFEDKFTHFRRGMGSARSAWMTSAGVFLFHLQPRGGMTDCLDAAVGSDGLRTPTPFYVLDKHPQRAFAFYSCVIDAIEAGALVIPADEHRGHNVAALMHLVRMTHSALPFILRFASP